MIEKMIINLNIHPFYLIGFQKLALPSKHLIENFCKSFVKLCFMTKEYFSFRAFLESTTLSLSLKLSVDIVFRLVNQTVKIMLNLENIVFDKISQI